MQPENHWAATEVPRNSGQPLPGTRGVGSASRIIGRSSDGCWLHALGPHLDLPTPGDPGHCRCYR